VYLPRSKVAHQLPPLASPNDRTSALCGLWTGFGLAAAWWGTGSQAEHDRVAALPLCWHCTRIADSEGGP
jgi:hypothetical protein